MEEPYLRNIIRLLGETTATPGGHAEKKRTLVEAIASLTGSDAWVWTLSQHSSADDRWKPTGIFHGGLTTERLAALTTATEHPDTAKAAGHFHAVGLANHLDLSPHTTKDDFRSIYRHYEIGSRAELMKQSQIRGNHFKPQNPNE